MKTQRVRISLVDAGAVHKLLAAPGARGQQLLKIENGYATTIVHVKTSRSALTRIEFRALMSVLRRSARREQRRRAATSEVRRA